MFPTNTLTSSASTISALSDITVKDISNTPLYDWTKKSFTLYNGAPQMISKLEAIRQWIIVFLRTPKGVYEIYGNYSFGTSVRKLFGRKRLNNGYEESELEREIREGLPLCPAIKRVTSFNLSKDGGDLIIDLAVELYDGTLITVEEENVYTIR